jgi:hypothetical protein
MGAALENFDATTRYAVDQAVGGVDVAAPVASEIASQWFGFANSAVPAPVNVLK